MRIHNSDLPTVVAALRAAEQEISSCFVWLNTSEGHDYWSKQADHLLSLAKQIEDNPEGYGT